jgi:hypothetical protein
MPRRLSIDHEAGKTVSSALRACMAESFDTVATRTQYLLDFVTAFHRETGRHCWSPS